MRFWLEPLIDVRVGQNKNYKRLNPVFSRELTVQKVVYGVYIVDRFLCTMLTKNSCVQF